MATRPPETPANETKPSGLQGWTKWLLDKEMPVFSRTVRRLNQSMGDRYAGVADMATIILEDPSLTAKMIKLSNSILYNPGRQPVATITRGIVLLGLNVIRELALACSFIETVSRKRNNGKVQAEMARAMHASVQARSLAEAAGDPSPEEVFIAALLQNIGDLAFWCFEHGEGEIINKAIAGGAEPAKAEREVLGFRLRQLGGSLAHSWGLGGLIEQCFQPNPPPQRTVWVQAGWAIAKAAEHGWESPEMETCLSRVVKARDESASAVRLKLIANAEKAVQIARQFGANEASALIPVTLQNQPKKAATAPSPAEATEEKSDLRLLQVMQDLTALMMDKINLSLVIETVLEGVYRALNLDRVLFMVLTPDRRTLQEKTAMGFPGADKRTPIRLAVSSTPANLLGYALERHEAIWHRATPQSPYQDLITPALVTQLGKHECLVSTIGLEGRPIGLFYADRAYHGGALTKEIFDGFCQLTRQVEIAIKLSQMKS